MLIVDEAKVRDLVQTHFGTTLLKMNYSYSEDLKMIDGKYYHYQFIFSNLERKIVFDISNFDELLNHKLFLNNTIFRLNNKEKYGNRIDPEYFYYSLRGDRIDYDKYKIDPQKNYLEELERVMSNYAQLLFGTDLYEVIKGETWYDNIEVPFK